MLDLDWSWIKALPGKRIGELRIHDKIGDCDNLRIIFWAPADKPGVATLWILSVLQKKRNEFTKAQIANYRVRMRLIEQRFYENR